MQRKLKGGAVTEVASSRRVTAADIAKAVGVSRATVGFVLNNTPGKTISEATRARVFEAAQRLGYRPNRAAADLARGRSKIVLLVLPERPLGISMQDSLNRTARALADAGLALVTQAQTQTADGVPPLWESLNPDVVIGWTAFTPQEVASMHAAGVRRIRPRPGESISYEEAPGVSEGARLQVDHVHELGHRRIAVATPAIRHMVELQQARAAAAVERAAELGVSVVEVRAVAQADGTAAEAVRAWHADGVTAVVAYDDDVAAAVAGAAVEAGLKVPDDLAVIGHDDSPIASLFVPPLSSVRMDTEEAARYVAAVALHEAEGRPMTSTWNALSGQVVARRSTTG
jgi:DNA-binding LacI/PurR family transcriptional regulator